VIDETGGTRRRGVAAGDRVGAPDVHRCARLIRAAIEAFGLDLGGLTVLTEAASGPFVLTPLIAALAGAEKVRALTRDSRYATSREVEELTAGLAERWGVGDRIEVLTSRDDPRIAESDVVTNLGFVRPLDRAMLARLGPTAAIALMFETWERRDTDIDLACCRELGIPVLGTNEDDPRLRTFEYLPLIAAKLLLDLEVEVHGSRLVLVAGGKFAHAIEGGLARMGATVETFAPSLSGRPGGFAKEGEEQEEEEKEKRKVAPTDSSRRPATSSPQRGGFEEAIAAADAIIVADHPGSGPILGPGAGQTAADLLEWNPGIVLVHISGDVDAADLAGAGLRHAPERIAPPGHMSVTAGYLGPKPVIDLHTAGLAVGAALARARRRGLDGPRAEESAVAELPLAQGFPKSDATTDSRGTSRTPRSRNA
jgi:hypothetical protein